MTVAERIAVEEFDDRYPNVGKLRLALTGYPGFDKLKPITSFTNEEKVLYMRVIHFIEDAQAYQRAAHAGLVPLIDFFDDEFEIPPYVDRCYFHTHIAS